MPRESYDLIVLGDELPGLIAATLCARRGMRVLLAEIARPPTSYSIAGVKLPVEPLLLPGLTGPVLRRVLDELHFQHLVKRKLRPSSPAFQLVGPDARLDVDADDATMARELAREARDEEAATRQLQRGAALSGELDRLLDGGPTIPPTGFWERRELQRLAGALVEDAARWAGERPLGLGDPLSRLPALLASGAATDPDADLAVARAFEHHRQGAPRLAGDHDTLREMFLDKFASHSGELRIVEPSAIATSWGKASGVVLASGEELAAGHIVAAMPVGSLERLLEGKPGRRIAELAAEARPVGYRYTLNLVLDAIGVPEGMGPLVFAVGDPAAPLVGGNAFAIHAGPADDKGRVPITIQAIAPVPEAGEELAEVLDRVRTRLRRDLELVMPFVGEYVRLAHSPNQSVPAEGADAELAVIAPARPLWRPSPAGALGLAGLDYATGVKHLTLASSQVLPGLGIEGEFLAGWSAARIACEGAGKKRDYLQGETLSP